MLEWDHGSSESRSNHLGICGEAWVGATDHGFVWHSYEYIAVGKPHVRTSIKRGHDPSQRVREQNVIGIKNADKLSFGVLNSPLPGGGYAGVRLMNHSHARITGSRIVKPLPCRII